MGGSGGSDHMDLAWEPEGGWHKSSMDYGTECGLGAGEVPSTRPTGTNKVLPL